MNACFINRSHNIERVIIVEKSSVRYFMAIAFIGFGAMLVLDNFGVLESDIKELWHYVYPAFFIVFGFSLITRYLKYKGSSWIFGLFFIVFGGALILGRMEIIEFQFKDIFKLWPLIIIYIGFKMIGWTRRKRNPYIYIYDKDRKNVDWGRFSVGDFEFSTPNWKVEPMNLTKAAGDFYLDFTKAFIPEEEIPIRIDSWAGDVHVLLPEDLSVRISASVKAGDINLLGQKADGVVRDLFYESPDYETAIKKIDMVIDLKAGSIRVDKV